MTEQTFTIVDPDKTGVRLASKIGAPTGNTGDVMTVQADGYIATAPASGGTSDAIPQADTSGVTIDSTTYDNPISGTGKMRVLVFPADTAAIAIALEGDAFPRWLLASDATDGLYVGDGTFDPYASGASINETTDASSNSALEFARTTILAGHVVASNLPTADPHVVNELWNSAGTVKVSAG